MMFLTVSVSLILKFLQVLTVARMPSRIPSHPFGYLYEISSYSTEKYVSLQCKSSKKFILKDKIVKIKKAATILG